jgi:hypothetical protein
MRLILKRGLLVLGDRVFFLHGENKVKTLYHEHHHRGFLGQPEKRIL